MIDGSTEQRMILPIYVVSMVQQNINGSSLTLNLDRSPPSKTQRGSDPAASAQPSSTQSLPYLRSRSAVVSPAAAAAAALHSLDMAVDGIGG